MGEVYREHDSRLGRDIARAAPRGVDDFVAVESLSLHQVRAFRERLDCHQESPQYRGN